MGERSSVVNLILCGWRDYSRYVECSCTRIGDENCLCSSFTLKYIDVYWCEGNCGNSTEEFDENEFGDTENGSEEDDHHYSDENLGEYKNKQDNNNWQRRYYKKILAN